MHWTADDRKRADRLVYSLITLSAMHPEDITSSSGPHDNDLVTSVPGACWSLGLLNAHYSLIAIKNTCCF